MKMILSRVASYLMRSFISSHTIEDTFADDRKLAENLGLGVSFV